MMNRSVLHHIENSIKETEAQLKKYKFSWKLYERLSLLTVQKEAIEKGEYWIEKTRYKEYYEMTVYFKDGTYYKCQNNYIKAVS